MHSDVRQDAKGRWPDIFAALGIDVGDGKHKACPVCGGRDRFRFDDINGAGSWFCNQCDPHAGDGFALIMKVVGCDFAEAAARVRTVIGGCALASKKNHQDDAAKRRANRRRLIATWKASAPVTEGCPVDNYLRGRGFDYAPPSNVIRYCPSCYEPETAQEMPAMVAVVLNPEGQADTLHRTYLTRNGESWIKAQIEKPKKLMPGVRKIKGSAIRLFQVGEVVGIAEGIETALACERRFKVSTWAAVSSSILQAFEPPAGIKRVIIFGDNDFNRVGQSAAGKLATRLLSTGYDVRIEISPLPGKDWADIPLESKRVLT
ncbi:MAG: hypothetical protein HF981_00435 [Desulfobacteraceae bacterium]|nr:hypothetical protein [Desulfobacteraceae bacterium]MBC2748835.1 toprim domain-containing protein [Desulfobacteraceae bacterium]